MSHLVSSPTKLARYLFTPNYSRYHCLSSGRSFSCLADSFVSTRFWDAADVAA